MIDARGHVILIDFGLSKQEISHPRGAMSLVGIITIIIIIIDRSDCIIFTITIAIIISLLILKINYLTI